MLRRSGRIMRRPDYLIEHTSVAESGLEEPTTVEEALASQQKVQWDNAKKAENMGTQGED